MKSLIIFVFTAIISVNFLHAQTTTWVTHKADDRVSLKFPAEPIEKIKGTFIATSKDSSIAYVFTVVDFKAKMGVDSTAIAPYKATPEFAAQLKAGIIKSLPTIELEDFKIGTWKGFTNYTSTGVDNKSKKYFMFMFIIGNKLYSVSSILSPNADLKKKDEFASTIEISN